MTLGLIPARGGSKGLPRKNVKPIAGKPLIVWTIEAAQKATRLDRFLVSTDDEEIACVARSTGAEVVDRPPELATDEATSLSVWAHALDVCPAEILVNLYPTSPIRDDGLIDRAIALFESTRPSCLATGFISKDKPFGEVEDGVHDVYRRQDVKGFFCDDGNVYVVDASVIRSGRQYGDRLGTMIVPRDCNIEIDDDFDLWLAEKVLERRMAEGSQGGSRDDTD